MKSDGYISSLEELYHCLTTYKDIIGNINIDMNKYEKIYINPFSLNTDSIPLNKTSLEEINSRYLGLTPKDSSINIQEEIEKYYKSLTLEY